MSRFFPKLLPFHFIAKFVAHKTGKTLRRWQVCRFSFLADLSVLLKIFQVTADLARDNSSQFQKATAFESVRILLAGKSRCREGQKCPACSPSCFHLSSLCELGQGPIEKVKGLQHSAKTFDRGFVKDMKEFSFHQVELFGYWSEWHLIARWDGWHFSLNWIWLCVFTAACRSIWLTKSRHEVFGTRASARDAQRIENRMTTFNCMPEIWPNPSSNFRHSAKKGYSSERFLRILFERNWTLASSTRLCSKRQPRLLWSGLRFAHSLQAVWQLQIYFPFVTKSASPAKREIDCQKD